MGNNIITISLAKALETFRHDYSNFFYKYEDFTANPEEFNTRSDIELAIGEKFVNGSIKYDRSYYYFKYKIRFLIDNLNTIRFLYDSGLFIDQDEETVDDLNDHLYSDMDYLISLQLEIEERLKSEGNDSELGLPAPRARKITKEKHETALDRLDYAPFFHGLKKANIFPMELRSNKIFSQLLVDLNITSGVPTTQQLFSDFNNRSDEEKARHVQNVIDQLKNTIHWLEVEFLDKKIEK